MNQEMQEVMITLISQSAAIGFAVVCGLVLLGALLEALINLFFRIIGRT